MPSRAEPIEMGPHQNLGRSGVNDAVNARAGRGANVRECCSYQPDAADDLRSARSMER
jgi:hypothetical protein